MKMIEEGKFAVKSHTFNVKDLFNFITLMFEPQLKVQNNHLELEMQYCEGKVKYGELPRELTGDQIRLKQILINLTKNALKFTVNGSIRIKASYDYDAGLLKVQVSDTGAGINETEKDKLFQMFSKGESH